jgi:uncharacterized protein DUF1566
VGLLSRTKRAEPAEAKTETVSAGRKILLNFGGRASKAVEAIAAATLEAGGFDVAGATPQIGVRMPDGTIYAGISPDTGNPMYAAPADALTMEWHDAMDYAVKLDAHGHRDWRVPTKGELNVLFNNRAALGGFNETGANPAGWYWSSSPSGLWTSWAQRFSDGCQLNYLNDLHTPLRCVR